MITYIYIERRIIIDNVLANKKLFKADGTASENLKYLVFLIYGLILIIFGLIADSPNRIIYGLYKIIIEPDLLITDYIGVGGIGAAFVNSGLLTVISIFIMYHNKIRLTGATISAIWLISGFSLFGKNIFNVWFVIIGVLLHAKYQREPFAKYIYFAFLGTSLSPMVTQIMLGINLPRIISVPLGAAVGIFMGFILPPLASYLMRVHQGFNLYNTGFTAGIIGTVFVSLLRSYGVAIESRLIWTSGNNLVLGSFLIIMFLSMIMYGIRLDRNSISTWKNIFKYHGKLVTDFTILQGFPATLINMGINGLFATFYIILIGGDLNGPTIGGIFTIVGFGSFGKHLKNIIPILIGVFIGGMTKTWSLTNPSVQLAALFGTTLAPIAGEFGWKYGIIAGFLQSSVALYVGYLHGGLNLYNSGFAGGIVAAVIIPIVEAFRKDEF